MISRTYLKDVYRESSHEGRLSCLRLDMNENPEGLPREFFDKVMGTVTPEILAAYPEIAPLKRALSKYLDVAEDCILVTNGSDDAIYTVFDVFGERGKEVVSVYPTFAMYMVNAAVFDMRHVAIDYEDDLTLDINKVLEAINENTRIVAMLNPNNPIGNVYSREEVLAVVDKAAQVGAMVVIDEAYHYFYDKTFIDIALDHDNIILTRTFSKLCSIAALRVGYVVSRPENISYMQKVKPTYNVNQLAIVFARAILEEGGLIESLIETEHEGRAWIINRVAESGRSYFAQNGNYVFIKCNRERDFVFEGLRERGVLVKKYTHPLLEDYIRISTGSVTAMSKFWDIFIEVDS